MSSYRKLLVPAMIAGLASLSVALPFSAPVAAAGPGTITEYPIPTAASLPFGITPGPDGKLWFGEYSPHQMGRITTAGTFAEFKVPSGATLVTAGPDGNIWYSTNAVDNKIGKITTAGVPTEYAIPAGSNGPGGITAGPDGNLWFALFVSDQIGRITPSGSYTIFNGASEPEEITTGPDGNLWFTEVQGLAGSVSRMTTAGAITRYETPTPFSFPIGITAGPDGNLWFTEEGINKIGRITLTGSITEFAIPTPASSPYDITAGPDGNLWFTEHNGNKIGRITPSGSFTEFSIPTAASAPFGITTGPDGNVWFVEQSGNKIGRITTGCHEADGDGEFQDSRTGHHGNFHFDRDSCEEQDIDRVDSNDRGDGKDFHSTEVQSASFDDITHSVILTGLGVSAGNPVAFTVIAKEGTITTPGWFSISLSDGFTSSGYLLSGTVTLQ